MVRNPSRKTQELLDKSYKVVENYEKKSKFNSYSDFMNKASTLKLLLLLLLPLSFCLEDIVSFL